MVGGQDEIVFDGNSFALNVGGELVSHLPSFSETVSLVTVSSQLSEIRLIGQIHKPEEGLASCYSALMVGIRDYVEKNNFPGVVLGLSGGIDSALVAVLAADALGADKVSAIMMPSEFTADISLNDAKLLADNLGIDYKIIPIGGAMSQMDAMLEPYFNETQTGIAEENIQSRLRGLTLMAYSNKFGSMVLATGNKSEYAAGYATLYGDMCGGYAPIKDVWKTTVFELCKWRNNHIPRLSCVHNENVIPERIITRPPSAELRADQQDTDSLPEYDILDPILIALTEEMADIDTITSKGFNRSDVETASQLLFRAEYKRFQAAPGPKITPRAFGRDRRLPLTSGFRPASHNR
jgi:NAD+ synthase